MSFAVTITYPSTGTAPYPAIIAYGGGSIPAPAGVAMINFNNDDMAAQVSTGKISSPLLNMHPTSEDLQLLRHSLRTPAFAAIMQSSHYMI
jgi:hypothetical protein